MSSTGARIQADLAEAAQRFPNVSSLEVDGECFSFCVAGQEFTAVLPDVYGQVCDVYGPDEFEASCRGSIVDIVAAVLDQLEALACRDIPIPSLARHISVATAASSQTGLSDPDALGLGDEDLDTRAMPSLIAECNDLEAYGMSCSTDGLMGDQARVTLAFPVPEEISRSTAEAWGLDRERPLRVSLVVSEAHYARRRYERLDAVFFQEKTTEGFTKLDASVQLSNIAKTFWQHLSGSAVPMAPPDGASQAPERLKRKKEDILEEAKQFGGFLLPLARYMQRRLTCLHEYCVICDEPLTFPPLLRPTVCTRTLCSYSARAFGEAVTGEFSGQNASLEVWDLLAAMAICAGRMPDDRMRMLFGGPNFPSLFLPGSQEPALQPSASGFEELRRLLQALAEHRSRHVRGSGVFWLNHCFNTDTSLLHPLIPALIGWIWDSNRSYMMTLAEDARIDALSTPYQYLLLSAPPEQEATFQALKAQHGSEFCFHGSAAANWHCILRQGLKNASGTSLMTAGQAYGPGIYLARDSRTSAAYSGAGAGQPQPARGPKKKGKTSEESLDPPSMDREVTGQRVHDPDSLVMLAICEVAQVPTLRRANAQIWVCPDEAAVVTRFFLVYRGTGVPVVMMDDSNLTKQLAELAGRWTSP